MIKRAVAHVNLSDVLEIRKDFANGLSIFERNRLIVELDDFKLRKTFEGGEQVLI